ncbi:hypothetical protein EF60_02490 [Salmonella enterica]|nr:hypothetical protein [Salmonella enterica]
MSDMCCTRIPELLAEAIKNAAPADAWDLFNDADYFNRRLAEGLINTGRLLSLMCDCADPSLEELRCLGDSIAATAELMAGFSGMILAYNQRIRNGETGLQNHPNNPA